jgi:hypothetical protein
MAITGTSSRSRNLLTHLACAELRRSRIHVIFQELYRPFGPKRGKFLLPCSSVSPLVSRVLNHCIHVPGYTAEFRSVRGFLWGSPLERGVVGILWGRDNANAQPGASVTPTAEVRAITHSDEGRGKVRSYRCLFCVRARVMDWSRRMAPILRVWARLKAFVGFGVRPTCQAAGSSPGGAGVKAGLAGGLGWPLSGRAARPGRHSLGTYRAGGCGGPARPGWLLVLPPDGPKCVAN